MRKKIIPGFGYSRLKIPPIYAWCCKILELE